MKYNKVPKSITLCQLNEMLEKHLSLTNSISLCIVLKENNMFSESEKYTKHGLKQMRLIG